MKGVTQPDQDMGNGTDHGTRAVNRQNNTAVVLSQLLWVSNPFLGSI